MNLAVRALLLAAAGAVAFALGGLSLLQAGAGTAAAFAFLALAQVGRLRPWADLAAWAAIGWMAWEADVDATDLVGSLALAGLAIAWLGAALVPTRDALPVRLRRAVLSWLPAAALAWAVTGLPVWMAARRAVAAEDPVSPAGAALRVAGLLAVSAVVVAALLAGRRLRSPQAAVEPRNPRP